MAESEVTTKHIDIVEIPVDTKYWIVRADGGKYTNDFYYNNKISIDGENLDLKFVYDNYDRFRKYLIDKAKKKNKDISVQSISSKSRKIHNFVKNIKENDIVMTPYKESNQFLLGIVTSGAQLYSQKDLDKLSKKRNKEVNNYPISKNKLYRNVRWLRVVSRSDIDSSLLYMLRMHQTVISLENNIQHIDKLISPIYIKSGKIILSVKVNKQNGIDSDEWEDFYSSINKLKTPTEKIEIKSNVQSPGVIELIETYNNQANTAITIISLLLTGKDPAEFIIYSIKKLNLFKPKKDPEKERIEHDSLKLDNEYKKVEIEFKKQEVRKLKLENDQKENEIRVKPIHNNKTLDFTKIAEELQIKVFDRNDEEF